MGLLNIFKKKESKQEQIIRLFYSDYPEKPFISDDRDCDRWLESARMFPRQTIIPKTMMTRYKDGLLPGHVYMIYWLEKYTNKKIPAYFEYKYGIDFEKEKKYLHENGFLDESNKPTNKGNQVLKEHHDVIDEQHPKPQYTGTENDSLVSPISCGRSIPDGFPDGFSIIPKTDKNTIHLEIQEINQIVKTALKLAKLRTDLTIDVNELSFDPKYMFYEFHDLTPTKRKVQHPLTLHYATTEHGLSSPVKDYFGEIHYSRNGKIAGGRLIFWKRKKGFMIHLKTVKNTLLIDKVETTNQDVSKWLPIYKYQT